MRRGAFGDEEENQIESGARSAFGDEGGIFQPDEPQELAFGDEGANQIESDVKSAFGDEEEGEPAAAVQISTFSRDR